jgi:hypothetical protein
MNNNTLINGEGHTHPPRTPSAVDTASDSAESARSCTVDSHLEHWKAILGIHHSILQSVHCSCGVWRTVSDGILTSWCLTGSSSDALSLLLKKKKATLLTGRGGL